MLQRLNGTLLRSEVPDLQTVFQHVQLSICWADVEEKSKIFAQVSESIKHCMADRVETSTWVLCVEL